MVSPAQAAQIVAAVDRRVPVVGVFVNARVEEIEALRQHVRLDLLQFHGDEPPEYCHGWNLPVIKALRIRDAASARAAVHYPVDWILADAFVPGEYGGTGHRVPIEWLRELDPRRLILAGGLAAENVVSILRAVRPYAVDVASGVESGPGKKDQELMRRFIENVRAA